MALDDNLISFWPLDEASGNAIDAHGAYDLTETSGTIGAASGLIGTARVFAAADSEYFSIADNADLSITSSNFTFNVWVKAVTVSGFPCIVSKGWGTGSPEFVLYYHTNNAVLSFAVDVSGVTHEVNASNFGALPTGQWVMVTIWKSGTTIGIAVNGGTPNTTTGVGTLTNSTANFVIGAGVAQSIYFDGQMALAAYAKRDWTSDERTIHYNGGAGLAYPFPAPALICDPDIGQAGRQTIITVEVEGAEWLTSPPDFGASDGTIVSSNVLTNETATIVYQAAQSVSTTVTITDDTTESTGNFEVVAPYVLVEGDSQNTTAHTTLAADVIAGLRIPVDTSSVATGGQTITQMITQIPTQISPLRNATQDKFVVYLFAGTNDYYLDDKTGQQVYDLLCEYADDLHALGANTRLVVVTTPNRDYPGDGGGFPPDDPDLNDRIDDGNVLIRANADGKLDEVVDINAILNAISVDPNDWTSDGVHLDQPAADAIQPAISRGVNRQLGFGTLPVFMHHYRAQGIA